MDLIKFFSDIGKLKFIKRRWNVRGVSEKDSESAADHAFRLALMSWFFAKQNGLDESRAIKISLIHDLCNIYIGEMTPYDKVLTGDPKKDRVILAGLPRYTKEEKENMVDERRKLEGEAIDKLLSNVPQGFAKEIKNLWLEYEEIKTPEGRFVRQVDRLEPLIQAVEYKKEGKLRDLNVYWVQAKEWLDNRVLLSFVEELDKHFSKLRSGQKKREKELVSP